MNSNTKLNPEKWVDNYADAMYSYSFSRVSKSDVAEDLVQETFFSALKSLKNFKGEASEKTWLYSILKRKIIDYYRKASSKYEKNFTQMSPFEDSGDWLGHWKDERVPNEWDDKEEFNSEEFMKILKFCMEFLPEKYSYAFKMKSLNGFESKEICNELDITTSNLWVILHRSRVQLRECLEKNWFLSDKH